MRIDGPHDPFDQIPDRWLAAVVGFAVFFVTFVVTAILFLEVVITR